MAVAAAALFRQAGAETVTVDRVVASLGDQAITESDVIREYRLEALLADGHVPANPPGPSLFQTAENRLIDQKLLERQSTGDPVSSAAVEKQAAQRINAIRQKFKTVDEYNAALRSLGLTQTQLLRRLEEQQRILLLIDERLRPEATVSEAEVEDYYEKTFLPQFQQTEQGSTPPLSQVQDRIRAILLQQKVNQLLANWLAELRTANHVEVLWPPK